MPLQPISPLNDEDVQGLSVDDLSARMDLVLSTALAERGWPTMPGEHAPSVRRVIDSPMLKGRGDRHRRGAAHAAFRFLVQRELTQVAHVAMNTMYYDRSCRGDPVEHSPILRMYHASFTQSSIILCRVAFECFVELLHIVREGKMIEGKSKFRYLKKWLFVPENPFCFFGRQVVGAYFYDRAHRTPEVHATSRVVDELVCLRELDTVVENERLTLHNIISNLWEPFIDIIDERKPRVIHGVGQLGDDLTRFANAYLDEDPTDLGKILTEYRGMLG